MHVLCCHLTYCPPLGHLVSACPELFLLLCVSLVRVVPRPHALLDINYCVGLATKLCLSPCDCIALGQSCHEAMPVAMCRCCLVPKLPCADVALCQSCLVPMLPQLCQSCHVPMLPCANLAMCRSCLVPKLPCADVALCQCCHVPMLPCAKVAICRCSVAAEGICVLGGWRSQQGWPEIFYAMLCRVLRKRSRGTLDNVQHALVTSLKARGRDTILV